MLKNVTNWQKFAYNILMYTNQNNTIMKNFFDKFNGLNGAQFIGIKNYVSTKTGEVANFIVLTNYSVMEAKKKDLQTLESLTHNDIEDIAEAKELSKEVVFEALTELIASARKNLSENLEDRTVNSQAQTDAYLHIGKSLKINKTNMEVFLVGMFIDKQVIVPGKYPKVNSRPKTIAKKAIAKHCDLRMNKYRNLKVGQIDRINVDGSTLVII